MKDPGNTVLDIFAGSNATGSAAEKLDRRLLAFDKDRTYLAPSAFCFVDELPAEELAALRSQLQSDHLQVKVSRQEPERVLMEEGSIHNCTNKNRQTTLSGGGNAH